MTCNFHRWEFVGADPARDGREIVVCVDCGKDKSRPVKRTASKPSRKPMKRSQPKRDWVWAIVKKQEEGCCRVCGEEWGVECAHIVGRDRDAVEPLRAEGWTSYVVHPDRIVPLCKSCHDRFDGRAQPPLDLLGKLTLQEELQAVADSAGPNEPGLESARVRLAPSEYRRRAA